MDNHFGDASEYVRESVLRDPKECAEARLRAQPRGVLDPAITRCAFASPEAPERDGLFDRQSFWPRCQFGTAEPIEPQRRREWDSIEFS